MSAILFSIQDHVAIIRFNRSDKFNSFNREMALSFQKSLDACASNETVRAVLITGEGKAFCAGQDLSEAIDPSGVGIQRIVSEQYNPIITRLRNLEKPVIAAVNGFALGGGCELAMSCHMRIAGEKARFGQPEVNLGIIPGYGGTQRLIQYIGKTKAIELLMTADMISAEEAYRLGLVNHVVPVGEEVSKAVEILTKIAAKAPIAIQKIIECVNAYFPIEGFNREVIEFANTVKTEDFKEGAAAFLEKRVANFQGK